MAEKSDRIEMTVNIVSAYVSANSVTAGDLPGLIKTIHTTISEIGDGGPGAPPPPAIPAVSIRRSIAPDFLTCLEDGRKFKSLKRHLHTKYGMSPEDYRAKWGLAKDYPTVAPNYAAERSELAKAAGLGQGGRQRATGAAKVPSQLKK